MPHETSPNPFQNIIQYKNQMDRYDLSFTKLPLALIDIIVQFQYGVPKQQYLNHLAGCAWINSREISIPRSWRNLTFRDQNQLKFHWRNYLKTDLHPFSMKSMVNLKQVRHAIRVMNWTKLKQLSSAAAVWAKQHTKKKLEKDLTRWSHTSIEHVFYFHRLLSSIDIPKFLCVRARRVENIFDLVVPSVLPLSFFINPPHLHF